MSPREPGEPEDWASVSGTGRFTLPPLQRTRGPILQRAAVTERLDRAPAPCSACHWPTRQVTLALEPLGTTQSKSCAHSRSLLLLSVIWAVQAPFRAVSLVLSSWRLQVRGSEAQATPYNITKT